MRYTVQRVETLNRITEFKVQADTPDTACEMVNNGDPSVEEVRTYEKGRDCDVDGWEAE